MEVFVVRHTTVAVLKEFCYGQTDVALSDTFESEWTALKDQLPTDFDAVFFQPVDALPTVGAKNIGQYRNRQTLNRTEFWRLGNAKMVGN